jgi:hypothetical protein
VEEEFPYPPPYSNFPLFCGSLAFPLLANTTISAPSLFSPDSGILHSAPLLGPKKLRTRPTGSYIPSQQLFTDSDSGAPPSPTYPHLSSPLLMLLGAPLSYLKGSRGAINLSGLVLCRPGLAWPGLFVSCGPFFGGCVYTGSILILDVITFFPNCFVRLTKFSNQLIAVVVGPCSLYTKMLLSTLSASSSNQVQPVFLFLPRWSYCFLPKR